MPGNHKAAVPLQGVSMIPEYVTKSVCVIIKEAKIKLPKKYKTV